MNMRTLASAIAVLALSQCAPAFASDADLADLTLPPLPIGVCNNEVEKAKANSNHIDLMRLAVCVHVNGNIDVAFNIYERIRKSVPGYAYVLVNMGVAFIKKGEVDKALPLLEQYLTEVGGAYGEDIAIDDYARKNGSPCRADSAHKVDCVNALSNLAAAQITAARNSTAVSFYLLRAIEIGDERMLGNVYANLGGHLAKIGDHDGAADAYIRGFWISLQQKNLDASAALLVRRAFLVPTVASSVEETEQTRISFKQRIRDVTEITLAGGSTWIDDRSDLFRVAHGISNIEDIRRVPMLSGALREWTSIQVPHFYMHYLGFHDLPIQKEVAHMFSLLCPSQLFEVSPHLADILSSKSHQRKKRIGFVSSLIGGDEPHGLLVLDVIRSLQGLFEFFVVSVGSKPPSSDFFHATNGNVFQVGYDDNAARNLLKSLELDCLVYAEAMNEAIVYFLGYQRFAKVQILVMGSPVSSGIPTFDYFISGDLLEHPFRTQLVNDHYSEQAVLFDGQAISFPNVQFHPRQDSALAAGDALSNITSLDQMNVLKSQNANIYLCFQSIFKVQPSFDHVLIDILQADHNGRVVLQASRYSIQTSRLQMRLKTVLKQRFCGDHLIECSAMADAYSRIHFISRVRSDQVIELMQLSDVVLHPFPFGGSKTASDAIKAGVPLVTFPQRHLRGRMAAVFFKHMALHEVDPDIATCCVADSVSDYVSKAIRLASDPNYRTRVRYGIKERSHRIFNEKSVSFEWGKFLTRALGVKISDDELYLTIGYVPEDRHHQSYISKVVEYEQSRWEKSAMLASILGPN